MPYKNINPEIWGPSLWKFLHYLTLSYPENPTEEEQNRMFDFLTSLQEILPCQKCRNNFEKHLTTLTDDILKDNVLLVKWLFNVHNEVNKSNNKSVLSYTDFIDIYSTIKVSEKKEVEVNNEVEKIKKVEKIKEKKNNKSIKISENYFLIIVIMIIIIIIVVLRKIN